MKAFRKRSYYFRDMMLNVNDECLKLPNLHMAAYHDTYVWLGLQTIRNQSEKPKLHFLNLLKLMKNGIKVYFYICSRLKDITILFLYSCLCICQRVI